MEEGEQQYRQMTTKPIPNLIMSLSIPTIASMLITNIYNLVDAYFVGKLGTSASAAIGIVLGVQAIFQAIGFMFGHGAGSIISRKLGEKDHEAARRFASTSFFLSLIASTAAAILGLLLLTPLMRLLGSTETILPFAKNYGFYILISAPALTTSCVLNNIMRYEGKAFWAMIGLVSGGVLNMIGDPILMFGLHMGMDGAGLSTALSQYISFFILLYMFLSGKTESKIALQYISKKPREIVNILKTGFPSLIRQTLNSVSTMALNWGAKPYGDATIAAMTIAGRVMMFIASCMIGIGQGYQPVAAYNYGAKKYSRIREGFFFTWKFGEIILGILAIIGFIFPGVIVRIFRDDPAVIQIGIPALRFQCISLLAQPFNVAANMMFQSIGKSKIASFLASLRSGLYYIPLMLLLPNIIGILGVQSAQMWADLLAIITTIPFVISFFRTLPSDQILSKEK